MIHIQDERIRVLEQDVYRMQHAANSIEEPAFAKQPGLNGGSSLQKQPSFKWATYGSKSVKSPTRPMPDDTTALSLQPQDSPRASPQALEHDLAVSKKQPLPALVWCSKSCLVLLAPRFIFSQTSGKASRSCRDKSSHSRIEDTITTGLYSNG